MNVSLVYNSDGFLQTKLSPGKARLYVRIIDNMGGVTIYHIPEPVTITLQTSIISDILASMLSNNCANQVVNNLQTGSMQLTSQLSQAVSNSLNQMATTDSSGNTNIDDRVAVRDILVTYLSNLPISDASSVKLVSSSFSSVSGKIEENSLKTSVCVFFFVHFRIYKLIVDLICFEFDLDTNFAEDITNCAFVGYAYARKSEHG